MAFAFGSIVFSFGDYIFKSDHSVLDQISEFDHLSSAQIFGYDHSLHLFTNYLHLYHQPHAIFSSCKWWLWSPAVRFISSHYIQIWSFVWVRLHHHQHQQFLAPSSMPCLPAVHHAVVDMHHDYLHLNCQIHPFTQCKFRLEVSRIGVWGWCGVQDILEYS